MRRIESLAVSVRGVFVSAAIVCVRKMPYSAALSRTHIACPFWRCSHLKNKIKIK